MRFSLATRFILLAILGVGALPMAATAQASGDFGTLTIAVRPPNADIFIDGEHWVSPDRTTPLAIQLAPGRHRVEVRAAGHRPFTTVVDIRRSESTPVNVILPAGPAPQVPPGEPPVLSPSAPAGPVPGPIRQVSSAASEDGFVWAPDFKITELNHRTTGFAGFYGGVVFGGKVMVGGGGYFQLDDYNHYGSEQMAYGGFVTELRLFHDKPVGLNLHGLVGGGAANIGVYYADYAHGPSHVDARHGGYYGYPDGFAYEGFFVGEPEAHVVARFGHTVRLVGGGGYRWTSADFNNLNGWTASVAVQFGK